MQRNRGLSIAHTSCSDDHKIKPVLDNLWIWTLQFQALNRQENTWNEIHTIWTIIYKISENSLLFPPYKGKEKSLLNLLTTQQLLTKDPVTLLSVKKRPNYCTFSKSPKPSNGFALESFFLWEPQKWKSLSETEERSHNVLYTNQIEKI
jgi:hypothetical protein